MQHRPTTPIRLKFYGVFKAVTGEVESLVTASVSGNIVKKYNFSCFKVSGIMYFKFSRQFYRINVIKKLQSSDPQLSPTFLGISKYLKLNGLIDATEVFIVGKILMVFLGLNHPKI